MHVIVIGAGAIGSLYGAKLSAKNHVTLVGRPDHVRAINEHGLRLEGLEAGTFQVPALERITKIEKDSLILVTTKVHATAEALQPIAPLVREDTTIISLQNGLGSEGIARATLPDSVMVLRGITQFGAIYEGPGVIRYMVPGFTLIEEGERSSRLAAVLSESGLEGRVSPNIRKDVWHKLIFNCVVNPLTTILGCEVGGIANPGLAQIKQLLVDECLKVAKAEGISFEIDFMHEIDAVYAFSHNIVSMRQDLSRGRRTEIDYLNGAVAALGAEHGLSCPVNSALTAIIHAMESTTR